MLRIIVVGPPACGKGTQGRKLAATLGLAYLSTGALLRIHMEMRTALGKGKRPKIILLVSVALGGRSAAG